MRHLARAGEILLFLCLALLSRAGDSPLPVVAANDNRAAAGELRDGVLNHQSDPERPRLPSSRILFQGGRRR